MIDELYSARILALAANMPHAGRLTAAQGTGEKAAKLCGSKAVVDVILDEKGRVARFAQDVKACALGQAAAGVVGQSIVGASLQEVEDAREAMLEMLKADGPGPQGRFEGLRSLRLVSSYPARHASTMVALDAAVEAIRQAHGRRGPDTRTRLAGVA